jgi:predicted enzyme related to lactoylglutathione lyase
MANHISWLEFVCTDAEATREFYSDVFGWNMQQFMPGYQVFEAEGGPGGGFRENCPPGTPPTVAYIEVESIDDMLKLIADAGGKVVVPKFEVSPDVGFVAFFTDPNGNILGLHSRT